jgi:hypothetical protein
MQRFISNYTLSVLSMVLNLYYPFVKEQRKEIVLLLICEDLKCTRFFNTLSRAGLNDSCFQPCLESIVLLCAGFENCSNDLIEFYLTLVDKHCQLIGEERESVMKEAMIVYEGLMKGKK